MSYRKPYPPEVRERAVRMVFEQQRPSTGVNGGVEEAVVLRVAWGSEAGAYAFHRQPESIGGATGKRFASPLGVPVGGAFVECVDRDHADREMLVCFDDSVQRLLQEPGVELSFAVALVAGEPGDERRAHLVEADQTAAFPAGQPFDFDRGGHECDVSGDHFLADRVPVGVVDGDERP